MDKSSVTVEAGFTRAFQTSHNLKASLPRFCCCKFHKHSVACGKDTDFLKMAIVEVKEDMVTDRMLIVSFSWYNTCVGLIVHLFKQRAQPLMIYILIYTNKCHAYM